MATTSLRRVRSAVRQLFGGGSGLAARLVACEKIAEGWEGDVFSLIGPKRYDAPWKDIEAQGWIAPADCIEVRVTLTDADILIVLVEFGQVPERSEKVLERAKRFEGKTLLLLNKVDKGNEDDVVEALQLWKAALPDAKVVPLSALHGLNVSELRTWLIENLPEHPPYFPKDELSDRNMRFFVSEMIREKVLLNTREEIPHSVAVAIDKFDETNPALTRIEATLYVDQESQKGIVIGKGGLMLKTIGTAARKDIEELMEKQVHLALHVKLRKNWRKDPRFLKSLGLAPPSDV